MASVSGFVHSVDGVEVHPRWGSSASVLTAESYRPVYVSHSLFPTCLRRDICVLLCGVTALGLQSMTQPSPAQQGHECEPAGLCAPEEAG